MSDILDIPPVDASKVFLRSFSSDLDMDFFQSSLGGLTLNLQEIDGIITETLKNWKFDRISLVDRSILRLGTYEIFFSQSPVPYPVVINEAVELAKKFGTNESGAFVNGVLDAIRKKTIYDGGGKN
ncbi:MAG: transcription antitermination factor NusB [Deltaproteobacteria bacterium]|nr:transcription antitermination factor NusB [Deltaproteobacteria bacterium]